MSVDPQEIEKIAELARIRIAETDIPQVTRLIAGILELVEQMQSVDTSAVEPMAHPLDATARLRPDVVCEEDRRSDFQAIAPLAEDGLYLVPRVID